MKPSQKYLCTTVIGLVTAISAHADRIVLAPSGLVLNPEAVKVETQLRDTGRFSRNWLSIGMPHQIIGLELEAERIESRGFRSTSYSAQYSLTGNGFTDIAPAISVGVRDITRSGSEGRAAYLAMSKSIGLSKALEQRVKSLKIHAGYGTSRLDGPFGGVTVSTKLGPKLSAEYVAHEVNGSIGIGLLRGVEAKVAWVQRAANYGVSILLYR